MRYSTAIGIDAHGMTNTICALDTNTGEMRETELSSEPEVLIEWINKQSFPYPIMTAYESGPTGFGLARCLIAAGIPCMVAASSRLLKDAKKKKNDREDARNLAKGIIAFEVYPVWIPSVEQEAACNLSRLRNEISLDLRRAKQRVTSFLLKMGVRYTKGKRWTGKFRKWADTYEFPLETDTYVFREKLACVYQAESRLTPIEERLHRLIEADPNLKRLYDRLRCLHGIGPVTACALVCEIGDFNRFKKGSHLASYLGLVPSEDSSGEKNSNGKITKAGNCHLRRLLVEAAGSYSKRSKLEKSNDPNVDPLVREHAHKGSVRLYKRRQVFKKRNKQHNKAKVAIARELAEWVYHIAVM